MIIYFFLFFIMLLFGVVVFNHGYTYNRKKFYSFFFFISISIVECFRSTSIGEDTINYVSWFKDFCTDGWTISILEPRRYVEPGFKMLNLLIATFTSNEHIFVAIVAIIISLLFVSYLRFNSEDFLISVMLFFGLNFFVNSMTAFRQFIAMGIAFWMLPLLLNKQWIKVVLVAAASLLFHQSSIIHIISVIFVYFFRKNRKTLGLIIVGECIAGGIIPILLNIFLKIFPKYDIYFKYGEEAVMGELRLVIILIEIFLLLYYYIFKKELHNEYNNCIFAMVSVSAFVGFLNGVIPHIFRLGYYFDFYLLLFIPILISKKRGMTKCIWKVAIISASFLLFSYYLLTNAGGVVPYKFL